MGSYGDGAVPTRFGCDRGSAMTPTPAREADLELPRRVGVLCNPHSGRNRRCLQQVREEARRLPGAIYREAVDPIATAQGLQDLLAAGAELLVINGGDGTLQAALTYLLGPEGPKGSPPRLMVVAGGTTNMSAADVGARAAPRQALRCIGAWLAGTRGGPLRRDRPVLRVAGAGRAPVHGMFFGAGAIHTGVEYFHRRIAAIRAGSAFGPGLAFARMLFSVARPSQSWIKPARLSLSVDEGAVQVGEYLLVLVSGLERLLLGSRPYWGLEPAPLHYTAIRYRPARLLRSLPFVLSGGRGLRPREQDGYFSHNINTLSLGVEGGFVLDGERFRVDADAGALRVSQGERVAFLAF